MRMAQDHIFGTPWIGTSTTTGANPLKAPVASWKREWVASGGRIEDGMAALLNDMKIKPFISMQDCMVRPHWTEVKALTKKEILGRQWPHNYFPCPQTVEENRQRYPWPQSFEWYNKLVVSIIRLRFQKEKIPYASPGNLRAHRSRNAEGYRRCSAF